MVTLDHTLQTGQATAQHVQPSPGNRPRHSRPQPTGPLYLPPNLSEPERLRAEAAQNLDNRARAAEASDSGQGQLNPATAPPGFTGAAAASSSCQEVPAQSPQVHVHSQT